MKIVIFILILFMLMINYNLLAQNIKNPALLELDQTGYYGLFFDLDLNYYHYSRNIFFSDYSYHNGKADLMLTYRKKFADRYDVNIMADYYTISSNAQRIDSESLYAVDNGSTKESRYDVILETVIDINKRYNYYIALESSDHNVKYYEYAGDFYLFYNYGEKLTETNLKAGIITEGVKGIHLNTPGNLFRKGLFAELLAKAYLSYNDHNNYSPDSNIVLLANVSYSWLNPENMMLTPAINNSYDFEKKSLVMITSLQFNWEYSAKTRIDSYISFGRKYRDGEETLARTLMAIKLNRYARVFSTYMDFYIGIGIGRPDSKCLDEHFGYDESTMSLYLGWKLLLGYK